LSEVSFDLSPVEKKPSRKYRKGSKYDPILDKFLKDRNKLVLLEVAGKEANYVRTQLKKRIEARVLKIDISVTNGKVYLEKES
jgi:hypothetical protein